MDDLSEGDTKILVAKDYGKAKIYLINQDFFPETTKEVLAELDEQIKVRKAELDELNKELTGYKD